MPRFTDDWVVDRTMFEYGTGGGNCACCSFNSTLFLPNGVHDMIASMSELETEAQEKEREALETSPWPLQMRNEIWGNRVKLRLLLKKSMHVHREVWETHGMEFQTWITTILPPKRLKKLLQVPRAEILSLLQTNYKIHSSCGYFMVLSAVMDQVANFDATDYATDGVGDVEVEFEHLLKFDKRGGFTLDHILNTDNKTMNEETVQILLNRIQSLGGPKLLDKKHSCWNASDGAPVKTSFCSDRRMIRLLIARYWADALFEKFKAYKLEQQENSNSKVEPNEEENKKESKEEEKS
jgi:hypothetical protein